jgi:putative hemolysin
LKNLINTEDLLEAARLNGFAGESAAKVLMLLSRFKRINKLYDQNSHKTGSEFIDSMIEQLRIKFELFEDELNNIPAEGPFITISNHPFGGIDGMLLIKLISARRPDYKVVPNFLLKRIEPLEKYIFRENPFDDRQIKGHASLTTKEILQHLENGSPVGIFPADEVSGYDQLTNKITDRKWQYPVLRMIRESRVPVIPIYFQGSNSRLFHILGRIHPRLQTVKLPSELFTKKKRIIRIRIGSPIPLKEQDEFKYISRYGRFMRTKTYALGTALEVKKFFKHGGRRLRKEKKIIDPVPLEKIEAEINRILPEYSLFKNKNYNLICVPSFEIPNIMNEIGRLRETTFRLVGEGTNQQLDIDEYDLYYYQMFIWDEEEKKIVGAYRVGKGNEIMLQYGIRGFYIQSLFRINRRFYPILSQALELGRSFIVPEYQKKPLPLFLLWRGILYFLLKNPEYRYLIGPVSISNRFSTFSKALIIKFIREHYYNNTFSKYIKPRKRFRVPPHQLDTDIIFENSSDINKLDKFIKDIETGHFTMPVLLKKYLKQNGKIVEFNIDPKFNNALDGLIVVDIYDIPPETISSLSKEINDESILERLPNTVQDGIKNQEEEFEEE